MARAAQGPQALHRARTTEAIIGAFSTLLYERGYDAVSLADVAEATGLARTAIYNYYPDKAALLVAYAAHEIDAYIGRLDDAIRPLDNPVDQLRAYLRMQVGYVAAHHLPPGPALRMALDEETFQALVDHVGVLEDRLAEVVRRGRDQRYLRVDDLDATVALISACVSRAGSGLGPDDDVDEVVAATEAFVLRALDARVAADGTARRRPR